MPPEFLPSKKIIITSTLLAIFIGWLFWVPTTETFKLKNLELGKKLQTFAQNEQADIDSDNDGLKDWEETLWHADINNSDTDGDGTPDGEEIIQGRNPAIPSPDDTISGLTELLSATSTGMAYQDGENLTKYVSREFLATYLKMKSSGKNPTIALPEEVIEKLNISPYEDKFSAADIDISGGNTRDALKKYFNSTGNITKSTLGKITVNEVTLWQETIANEDYLALQRLSTNITLYDNFINAMLTAPVPEVLIDTHLESINVAFNTKKSLSAMQELETDPLLAIKGWGEYLRATKRGQELLKNINNIITTSSVAITKNDPAYIFIDLASKMQ